MTVRIATATPPSTVRPRLKVYQFPVSGLTIDQCSISRVAVTIQEDGEWILNLQADQNSRTDPIAAKTVPQVAAQARGLPGGNLKQVSQIKRNQFVILIRGLGTFSEPLPTPPQPATLGKPVLFAPLPVRFWVQSGIPQSVIEKHHNTDASRYFDQIDRVEIEFVYH